MAQFDCLEKPLSRFFALYGRLVARQPLPFIIFPMLLTAGLGFGFLHQSEVTDATYLFTPTDAPSKYERELIHQKWPIYAHNYIPGRAVTQLRECQVIVIARNGANILEREYALAVKTLNDFIMTRVHVSYKGREYSYEELCLRWKSQCHKNAQIIIVGNMYGARQNVSFPVFQFQSHRIYVANSLGGVSLRRRGDAPHYVEKARAWMLIYHLKFQKENDSYVSGLWERELERQLLDYKDPFIELTFFHSQTLTEELKRNAEQLVPKFAVSFTVLVVFAVLCNITLLSFPWVDWVLSKPVLALCGVCNAGMGVVSSIGLLNFVGMPYNRIVLVMPFLAVSIGVDNMFLMVAGLRRTSRRKSVEERLSSSLSDSAISIFITALTDALSFGVGAITSIPAVQIFCVYTCIAILLTFIYQLTFFLGLMVLQAKLEEKRRHCIFLMETVPLESAAESSWITRAFLMGSRPSTRENAASEMSGFFRDWFAAILMHPVVKVLVLVWLCIYLGFAVWGCTLLREGLEPINLLVGDSYAIPHYHALEKYFWHYGTQVQVVVNNAPDLSQSAERMKVRLMISAFANTPHTIGEAGVEYFVDSLSQYTLKRFPPSALEGESFYRSLCHFLGTNTYDRWGEDVYWGQGKKCAEGARVESFRFLVGMRNFEKTWSQRATTEALRAVAAGYPQYNVTTFMPLWLFTDQYRMILPNTLQNIAIALGCMVLISLLLIPQPLCALWVALSIASIDVGVVGYMTLWGVNLDAISMITLIMSIGFSVDFSAHISYGYVVSEEREPRERVREALGALGWPILQGALSTVIGVAVLSSVGAYMIVTFFKTVLLVIVLGALHGLVFLPVLLSIFVRGTCVTRRPKMVKGPSPAVNPAVIPVRYYVVHPNAYNFDSLS